MTRRIEETAVKQWKRKEIIEGQPKIADQIIEQVKKTAASQEDSP